MNIFELWFTKASYFSLFDPENTMQYWKGKSSKSFQIKVLKILIMFIDSLELPSH